MKRLLVMAALLAVLVPGALWAQEELTLESLAEGLAGLVTRVEAIEGLFANPWSPEIVYTDDGICQSPLHAEVDNMFGRIPMEETIHQKTADAYRAQFGTSVDPARARLMSLRFSVDSSEVYIAYELSDKYVVETWAHCEFLGHSEWEAE